MRMLRHPHVRMHRIGVFGSPEPGAPRGVSAGELTLHPGFQGRLTISRESH